MEEEIEAVLGPIIEGLGAELLEVEFSGGTLRLVADSPGGIGSDQLAVIHRASYQLIEQQNLVKGSYSLEVTSQGLERSLATQAQFERSIGELISFRTRADDGKTVPAKGIITTVKDSLVTIQLQDRDGSPADEQLQLSIAEIIKAHTIFDSKKVLSESKKAAKGSSGVKTNEDSN